MPDTITHILRPSGLNRKWVIKGVIKNIIEDEDDDKYIISIRIDKDFRLIYWNLSEYVELKRNQYVKELEDTEDYHGNYFVRDIVSDWFKGQGKSVPSTIKIKYGFDSFILWKDQLSFHDIKGEMSIYDRICYELIDTYLEVKHNEAKDIAYVYVKHKLLEDGFSVYDDDKYLLEDLKYYPKDTEELIEESCIKCRRNMKGDESYSPQYGPVRYGKGSLNKRYKRKFDLKKLSKINKKFKKDHENDDILFQLDDWEFD